MSRTKSNRKDYLKRKLNNSGFDVVGKSLTELEEMYIDYKREKIMSGKIGNVEKKDHIVDHEGALIPTPHERHKESIDDEFYKVTKDGLTDREELKRDSKYENILAKVKRGYIPTSLELSEYTGIQQFNIMRLIPWNAGYGGQSSLIKGKGKHTYTDLDGKEIKKKEGDKKTWEF